MRVRTSVALTAMLVLSVLVVPAGSAQAAEFEILVEDFVFIPETQFVNAGDTVTWVWGQDPAPHNVTAVPAEGEEPAFEPSGDRGPGPAEPFSVDFDEPGTYPYICTIHSSPTGTEPGDQSGVIEVLPAGEPLPDPPRPAPEPGALPQATDNASAALAWSSLFADDTAPDVLLARDDDFADALSSGALQGLLDAPLLLNPTAQLDPRVQAELARLGAQTVYILGGTNAVSQSVEDSLTGAGYDVVRIAGATRLETATDLAAASFDDAEAAILARAFASEGATDPTQAFADSLAAGGAAARAGIPILLSETAQLSDATRTYLMAHPGVTTVYVVGGLAAISQEAEDALVALGIEVIRLAGATRFDTAEALGSEFYSIPPEVFLLVEGQADDAWAGGFSAASAAESAPILLANGDDLPQPTVEAASFGVPALCGPQTSPVACDRAAIAASAAELGAPGNLLAALSGAAEVPGPGAAEGITGDSLVLPTDDPGAICYELFAYGLPEPVTAAHIHRGEAGVAGDVVIPLLPPVEEFGETTVRSCVFDADPALVAEILADPGAFYANLHTAAFPDGALRGQLLEAETIGIAELSGAAEVPGPGEEMGGGFAFVVTDAADHTQLCYFITYGLPEAPTAGHVHVGGPDVAGPVVQALTLPAFFAGPEGGGAEGTFCLTVDAMVVEDLLADPGGFYLNVHTATFPDGAIRGQLVNPFAGPPMMRAGWGR